jgi:hypothetical protein
MDLTASEKTCGVKLGLHWFCLLSGSVFELDLMQFLSSQDFNTVLEQIVLCQRVRSGKNLLSPKLFGHSLRTNLLPAVGGETGEDAMNVFTFVSLSAG